ncbi:hypothetical protein D3C81_531390 [compost metagenome]
METLRTLFSYTQSKQAKVIAAWLLIPGALLMASREMWSLVAITNELVHSMTFLRSFPYVAACAVVFAVTGCCKKVGAQLRQDHKLF